MYTPPDVVDLALSLAEVTPGRRCRVLDPTCGDGAFLIRARARTGGRGALVGFDVDDDAVRRARARVPEAAIARADLFSIPAERAGGADAVVGNPPYVRQERLSAGAKARARARLEDDFPDVPGAVLDRIVGRGDLAVACAARCLRLARPGGRVALVVSSALLDADYARPLWELAARLGRVDAIVEAPAERWFPDAAVNAVIAAFEVGAKARRAGGRVAMADLRATTAEAARRVRSRVDLEAVASVREASADRPERWAGALRGSDAWRELEAAAAGALVPLGDLAEVRRGATTGANDVFYMTRARAQELEIEPDALAPLLRAPPRGAPAAIAVEPRATSHVALAVPPEANERMWARMPRAARYLAERAGAAERPTLRGRRPWWALPQERARLFFTKAYAARFVQQLAPEPILADQRVYAVRPRAGVDLELLAAVLNSSYAALAIESLGRASMGEGALEWTVAGAARLPVLDPRALSRAGAGRARKALRELAARPIGDAAYERGRPDRRALDAAVAAGLPRLEALAGEVRAAVARAATARAARAAAR